MNAGQVEEIVKLIRAGAARQDLEDARIELFALHVRPLPYERTLTCVRRWIATPNDDGRPKFVSSVDELLEACGVEASARAIVSTAAFDGRDSWPSVDGCGWELVAPGDDLPWGVLALRSLAEDPAVALPPRDETPALPSPAPFAVACASPVERLHAMALAVRRVHPVVPPPTTRQRLATLEDASTPEMRELVGTLRRKIAELEQEAAAVREMRADVQDELAGGEIPPEMLAAAVVQLLSRLAEEQDTAACVEAFRDAVYPKLDVVPGGFREIRDIEDEPTHVRIELQRCGSKKRTQRGEADD